MWLQRKKFKIMHFETCCNKKYFSPEEAKETLDLFDKFGIEVSLDTKNYKYKNGAEYVG